MRLFVAYDGNRTETFTVHEDNCDDERVRLESEGYKKVDPFYCGDFNTLSKEGEKCFIEVTLKNA